MFLQKHVVSVENMCKLAFSRAQKFTKRYACRYFAPNHAIRPSLGKPTVCRLAAAGCALCAIGYKNRDRDVPDFE